MDAELEFAIQPNTTGKQLFDQVRWLARIQLHHLEHLLGLSCSNLPWSDPFEGPVSRSGTTVHKE